MAWTRPTDVHHPRARQAAVLLAAAAALACSPTRLAKAPPPNSQVDVFTQLARPQSDILWIIEDSESMVLHQEQLGTSFPRFFEHLEDAGVDYRIAVTTTDIFDQDGALVGNPPVIVGNNPESNPPNTSNPQASFSANVRVGTNGAARDEGLEAASLALQRLQIQAGAELDAGEPVSFLRPQAGLFLIFVADEDDLSPDYDLQGVQYYWRNYLQAKGVGNEGLVQVAAVAGDPQTGCAIPTCLADGGAEPGVDAGFTDACDRYFEIAELAQGFFGSICQCDFDNTLGQLGIEALGLQNKFLLSRGASADTLSITVTYPCGTPDPTDNLICTNLASTCPAGVGSECDGGCNSLFLTCTVPELNPDAGALDGWSYGQGDNSITFTSSTQPGPNSQITVSYTVAGVGE